MLKGTIVYLITSLINAIIPFGLIAVLTRYLNPAEYGEVAMFQMVIAGASTFIGLSVHGAANRKYFETGHNQHEFSHFVGSAVQIAVASGVLTLLVALPIRLKLANLLGIRSEWIVWAIIISLATFFIDLRLSQWQVRRQAVHFGVFQIGYGLLNVIITLVFVVGSLEGANGRVNAQIISAALCGLAAAMLLKRDNIIKVIAWRPAFLKEALAFGVPLLPHTIGGYLLFYCDRIVINAELGLSEAGIYTVAMQASMVCSVVFHAINKAYVPWLFDRLTRNLMEEKRKIVLYTYVWFIIITIGAGLAFVVGPPLLELFAGSEYADSGSVLGWLVLGQVFGGMYLMVTNYIFYTKRTVYLSAVTIVSGSVNVALLLILTQSMGVLGAAIAFCASALLQFLLTWLVAYFLHPMPWFNLSFQK